MEGALKIVITPPEKMICKFCRWWAAESNPGLSTWTVREAAGHYQRYDCRRHAPVSREIRSGNYITYLDFPQTEGTSWCGEWQQVPVDGEQAP